jgi:hypothetical protein
MALDIFSRLLAVVAAVAFASVLTHRSLPMLPPGRWTVFALFALGFGMCTIAGIRDGLGAPATTPLWLMVVNGVFGVLAIVSLAAVLVGFDWRLGSALLGLAVVGSWLVALGYAIWIGLPSALLGISTLVVATGAAVFIWRAPAAVARHRPAST